MLTAHSLGGVMARQLIESFVNKTLAARHYELAVVSIVSCTCFHILTGYIPGASYSTEKRAAQPHTSDHCGCEQVPTGAQVSRVPCLGYQLTVFRDLISYNFPKVAKSITKPAEPTPVVSPTSASPTPTPTPTPTPAPQ